MLANAYILFILFGETHAAEVVWSKNEISSLSPGVHHEVAVVEQAEDVGKVEDYVAVCLARWWFGNVGLDILDLFDAAFWFTFVDLEKKGNMISKSSDK